MSTFVNWVGYSCVLGALAACGAEGSGITAGETTGDEVDSTGESFELRVHDTVTRNALSFLKQEVKDRVSSMHPVVDIFGQFAPALHFDDCRFSEGVDALNRLYRNRILPVMDPAAADDRRAQLAFGVVAHAIQDFYAHSNFAEYRMASATPQGQHLGNVPPLFDGGYGFWRSPGEGAQLPGTRLYLLESGLELPPGTRIVRGAPQLDFPFNRLFTLEQAGSTLGYGIVSGKTHYWLGGGSPDLCPASGPSHWASLGGISKDQSGRPGFDEAVDLATKQMQHEWCRLKALVAREHRAEGLQRLCAEWVEDAQAADKVCPGTLPAETRCVPRETIDFRVSADDYAQLYVDGSLIASYDASPWGLAEGSVELTRGWHDIRLEYANRWGSTHLSLFFKRHGEADYRLVERPWLRSSDASGAPTNGLLASYSGEGQSFTVYGEGPIRHGWPSLYQGQTSTLWGGVYNPDWALFSETLTGEILID